VDTYVAGRATVVTIWARSYPAGVGVRCVSTHPNLTV